MTKGKLDAHLLTVRISLRLPNEPHRLHSLSNPRLQSQQAFSFSLSLPLPISQPFRYRHSNITPTIHAEGELRTSRIAGSVTTARARATPTKTSPSTATTVPPTAAKLTYNQHPHPFATRSRSPPLLAQSPFQFPHHPRSKKTKASKGTNHPATKERSKSPTPSALVEISR